MNAQHLHLLLNHVPVLGSAFGLGLLAYGLWRKSDELKKTAFGVFVIAALLAVPVYLTGEPAEDGVKSLPGVSKAMIGQHEEAAEVAFTAIIVLGVIALIGLFLFRRGRVVQVWFASLMLVVAIVVTGLMAWTANLGGQVRHTEIRSSAASAAGKGVKHDA
jgi:uncharacterized membrane protein